MFTAPGPVSGTSTGVHVFVHYVTGRKSYAANEVGRIRNVPFAGRFT